MKPLVRFFIMLVFLSLIFISYGQTGLRIKSNGMLTVNGNLNVTPAFVCGDPISDSRDGKTYKTVLIATQCWMAENLDAGTRISGSTAQADNGVIEKHCYDDMESNCDVYGGLYTWNEAMQYVVTGNSKGVCPTGWHVPSDAEWSLLTTYLGEGIASGSMKETGTAHWYTPNTGATNISGFTALPGGARYDNGSFYFLTTYAYYWSSSQAGASASWSRMLCYHNEYVYRGSDPDGKSFSVRCLKD